MIDAVLVELDGVIADTRAARRQALLDTLQEDGIALRAIDYQECCASRPVRAAVRAALSLLRLPQDETAIELAAVRAERRFSSLLGTGISLVDGARDLIQSLHGQTRLGIVTRASRSDIDTLLAMARLEEVFEFVIADDDAFQPKPSPAPYVGALERLARRRPVFARNVVALEDGPVGIRAARAAGVRSAVVGPVPVHLAVDADALLPTLAGVTLASLDTLTLGTHAER